MRAKLQGKCKGMIIVVSNQKSPRERRLFPTLTLRRVAYRQSMDWQQVRQQAAQLFVTPEAWLAPELPGVR